LTLSFNRHSIGKRLLVYILAFSTLITLGSTGVQLYLDYQRDVEVIDHRFQLIALGHMESLSSNMWNFDKNLISIQLASIASLPDIQYVRVDQEDEEPISLGTRKNTNVISHVYSLIHKLDGNEHFVGALTVEATLDNVYQRLRDRVVVILLSQGVKTFLVSSFILLVIQYMLTRHLTRMAIYSQALNVEHLGEPLTLQRTTSKGEGDELDRLVTAFNLMRDNLQGSYGDVIAAKQRADVANRARSTFFTNISHEIRTPLNAVLGYAQVLSQDQDITGGQRTTLLNIQKAGDHLLSLINDVLDMSRIETGTMEVHNSDFDLADLMLRLDHQFSQRCQQKRLTWRLENPCSSGVLVHGDRGKLQQVLLNLLGNAVEYTVQGEVSLRLDQEGGLFRFYVEDTGPGISESDQQNLFSPFLQDSGASQGSGTGLGLAIVQKQLELMGGSIKLDSRPGHGSLFLVELNLPLVEGKPVLPADLPPQVAELPQQIDVSAFRIDEELYGRLLEAVDLYWVSEIENCLAELEGQGEDEKRLVKHLADYVLRYDMAGLLAELQEVPHGDGHE